MPAAGEGDSCPGSITIMDISATELLKALPSPSQHQVGPASARRTVAVLSQAIPVLVPPLHIDRTPEDLHTLLCTRRQLVPGAAVGRKTREGSDINGCLYDKLNHPLFQDQA